MGSASSSLFGWLVGSFLLMELFPVKHFISLLQLPQGKGGNDSNFDLGEEITVAR